MAETLRDLGVVVDHPEPNVYEVAVGRRRVAVRAARGGGQDARQLHAPRPAPDPVRPGDHQQPGRRPDRPAAGRPPRRRDARARRRRSTTATATTSRRAPGRLRGAEIRFPFVSVMGTENAMLAATLAEGHTVIRPAAQEPEVDDLIAFLQKMGAEVERTVPGHDRGRGPQAPARRRAPGHPGPHRGRHVRRRRPRSPAAASRSSGAPCDHLGAFLEIARAGRRRRRRAARTRSRSTARALARRRLPRRATSRPRRTRASPPTSSRRRPCC